MSPSSAVHGCQNYTKYVIFEQLLHAAFVGDLTWSVFLEPACSCCLLVSHLIALANSQCTSLYNYDVGFSLRYQNMFDVSARLIQCTKFPVAKRNVSAYVGTALFLTNNSKYRVPPPHWTARRKRYTVCLRSCHLFKLPEDCSILSPKAIHIHWIGNHLLHVCILSQGI